LIERNGRFHQALSQAQLLSGGNHVLYTDIPADATPFRVLDFEFVPEDNRGIQ
jgi:hypothetical protein